MSKSPVANIIRAAKNAARNAANAVVGRANEVVKNAAPGHSPKKVATMAVRAANKKARKINNAGKK